MYKKMILFPAIAATAWAQQTAPAPSEAEKALRDRVEEFYKLMVEKKYRQAEAMVAEDSRDLYYNGAKPNVSDVRISSIEFQDGGRTARVTVKAKMRVMMMGAGPQIFDLPQISTWKEENGSWVWFFDPNAPIQTPFGPMKPGPGGDPVSTLEALKAKRATPESLAAGVKIDRTQIEVEPGSAAQIATITNDLPGGVELSLEDGSTKIRGLTVKLSPSKLNSGEKAEIQFQAEEGAVISDKVKVLVRPLNLELDILVKTP